MDRPSRRRVLSALGAASVPVVGGCLGDSDDAAKSPPTDPSLTQRTESEPGRGSETRSEQATDDSDEGTRRGGQPDVTVSMGDLSVQPGETGTLTVRVENTREESVPVDVHLDSAGFHHLVLLGSPDDNTLRFRNFEGQRSLFNPAFPAGETVHVSLRVRADSAASGRYRLRATPLGSPDSAVGTVEVGSVPKEPAPSMTVLTGRASGSVANGWAFADVPVCSEDDAFVACLLHNGGAAPCREVSIRLDGAPGWRLTDSSVRPESDGTDVGLPSPFEIPAIPAGRWRALVVEAAHDADTPVRAQVRATLETATTDPIERAAALTWDDNENCA